MKRGFDKQGFGQRRSVILLILAIGFACAWGSSAVAKEVYTWTDKDGIVHYSDTPPDRGTSEKMEIEDAHNPGTASTYTAPEKSTDGTSGTVEAGESPASAAQKRREQIRERQEERQEAKAEAEKMCARHQQRLAQMEPARRVFYTNEKGESVRMDDELRMGLIGESKEYIAKNCE